LLFVNCFWQKQVFVPIIDLTIEDWEGTGIVLVPTVLATRLCTEVFGRSKSLYRSSI